MEEHVLVDFTGDDGVDEWEEISDTVRSVGMSKASLVLFHNTQGTKRAIFFGLINPQTNGAGFAGSRYQRQFDDLSQYKSLAIRCRGQGQYKGYKIVLRHKGQNEEPYPTYEQIFQAPQDDFDTVFLPLSGFEAYYRGKKVDDAEQLDPSQITSLGIQAFGGVYMSEKQAGAGALEIDWIKANNGDQ